MEFDVVFEGGGAKGIVFCGAVEEFERRGHTMKRLVGTSAGSMTATVLAAGANAAQLREAIFERALDGRSMFTTLQDVPAYFTDDEVQRSLFAGLLARIDLPFVPDSVESHVDRSLLAQLLTFPSFRQVFSLIERGGFYEGAGMLRWIERHLEGLSPGLARATFEQFAEQTERDLSIIVSNTTAQSLMVLNRRTSPRCPVSWAVRMSMSIPFVWQEVLWRREWGAYLGQDVTGHTIVDGGVLSNFPMNLLERHLGELAPVMDKYDDTPNLGFLIDESLPVPNDPGPARRVREPTIGDYVSESRAVKRLGDLAQTMLTAHDKVVIESRMGRDEVCRLPAAGFDATDFDLPEARIDALIEGGRLATRAYLDRREPRELRDRALDDG